MATSAFNNGEVPETKHVLPHHHTLEENYKVIKRVDVVDLVDCNPDDLNNFDLFLQTKNINPVSIIAVKSPLSIEFIDQWLLDGHDQHNDDICILALKTPKIESCVTAVHAESDNVYNTRQTRIIWNRHPFHGRNHSISHCPRATYRADQVKRRLQQKLVRKTEEKAYSKSSDTPCNCPDGDLVSCCPKETNRKSDKRARKRQKSSQVEAKSDEQVNNLVEDPANEQWEENHSNATDTDFESSTVRKKEQIFVKSEGNRSTASVSHDKIKLSLSKATTEAETSRKMSVRRRRSNFENQRPENLLGEGSTFTGFEGRRTNDQDMVKRKQKKPFRDKSENKLSMALDGISPAFGKLKENIDEYAGAASRVKGIRDLTNLPHEELRWPVTIVAYPAKKSKANKSGSRRNQTNRANASRGAEGRSEPPIQVTDRSPESQRLPSQDLIVTSSQTVFGSITASLLPIPAIMSVDDEQAMISRLRGEPRTLNRDRPAVRPRHPEYNNQPARLQSFRNWPASTGQDASRMAVYGFFYTGQIDLIRCFQCGIGLKDWSGSDEPLFEHIRHSAQCPFLKELLGNDLLNAYKENLHINNNNNNERRENSPQNANRIRNPRYETLQSRLDSFENWPSTARQTPNALASAGLFFTGFNDLCRCYYCDGGLQRWEADDVPWVEHARWFPNCNYVKQVKGQAFINMVRQAAEAAQREDEDPPVFANKIREREHGLAQQSSNPIRQLTRAVNNLTLNRQELNSAAMGAVELGFSRAAVLQAIDEYNSQNDRRSQTYSTEDLVNILTARIDRGETLPTDATETEGASAASKLDPEAENKRLKGMVKCMECGINDTNILFLPCTHHKLCEACAESVTHCPVCKRRIEDKIKTFMS